MIYALSTTILAGSTYWGDYEQYHHTNSDLILNINDKLGVHSAERVKYISILVKWLSWVIIIMTMWYTAKYTYTSSITNIIQYRYRWTTHSRYP